RVPASEGCREPLSRVPHHQEDAVAGLDAVGDEPGGDAARRVVNAGEADLVPVRDESRIVVSDGPPDQVLDGREPGDGARAHSPSPPSRAAFSAAYRASRWWNASFAPTSRRSRKKLNSS